MAQHRLLSLSVAAVAVTAVLLGYAAVAGAAAKRGCASFPTQAQAQTYLLEAADDRRRGRVLDADRDGVACEHLGGPFKGHATLRYSRRGTFLFGFVSMPLRPTSEGAYPCLFGNTRFPDGPRLLHVYRLRDGKDARVSPAYGWAAQADPDRGRLVWKGEKRRLLAGRYYLKFEERVPTTPFGANPCPGFRSRIVELP